jgi:hypothetical protein
MSPRTGKITWDEDDHWPGIEIDQLRDDVEEATVARESAEIKEAQAKAGGAAARANYSSLKKEFESRIVEKHGTLLLKSMIYLDLIAEYETIVHQYAGYNGVKLSTTKIKHLRKRGGLEQ